MTKLSADDVRAVAKLCRLTLTDDEVERFSGELSAIFGYIERLQQVDTNGVEALGNVTSQENRFRTDDIATDAPAREALLECSPLPIVDNQIQTPSAHG